METQGLELAEWILEQARAAGASDAEATLISDESLTAGVRLGEVEKLKSSRERRLGLRVFVGQSSAGASTAALDQDSLSQFVADTVALARLTAADPWTGLPEPGSYLSRLPELELEDHRHRVIEADRSLKIARQAERAALGFDPRIKNSEGAQFHSTHYQVIAANSQGFCGQYSATSYSLAVEPIASDGATMERDYWYSASRRFDRIEDPETVGLIAAQRAVRRLGARKIRTLRAPVVFDPETAATLIGSLAGAASGPALYRGASFLVGRLGGEIASPQITIIDDGTMVGALGSRPFDGEGLPSLPKAVVDKGVLASYLLNTYSGRKLKMASTGNASRNLGDSPGVSPTNLYLQPGLQSQREIIGSIKSGFMVTELIGFGVNGVTGDYSRGASGMWIENGELAYPVHEVTVAGNLKDMFMSIEMVGDDLTWRSSVSSPTIKISEMTIAGR